MKLSELLKSVDLALPLSYKDEEITDIAYDSRKCKPGCAFVCLVGAASDGHNYTQKACENGAVVIFAEKEVAASVPVYILKDTRRALSKMSAAFFGNPAGKIKTIGITGTKGKTTTSYMIKSILEHAGYRTGVIGTIGVYVADRFIKTDNTTPESYLIQKYMSEMVADNCDYCIMEASSIGLRDYRIADFSFDAGVFTNFSADHIGGVEHKDMAEYMQCKSMLFKMCKTGIVNIDDPNVSGILDGHTCALETYGFNKDADYCCSSAELSTIPGKIGSVFTICGKADLTCMVAMPGRFNVYNALAASATALHFGIDRQAIRSGLESVTVKGRVENIPMPGNYTLLIDYAHNAISMESILTTLREYNPKRLICMFGAGGNRPKIRRYEMGKVCGEMADLSIVTADNSRYEDVLDIINDIKTGLNETNGKYIEIPDRKEAIRYCIENAEDGDIIVLAGKGHEDYQEIKGVKYPFDERKVIKDILSDLKKEGKIQ